MSTSAPSPESKVPDLIESEFDTPTPKKRRANRVGRIRILVCGAIVAVYALAAVVGPMFDRIAGSLVDAFVKRAEHVYG